MDYKIVKSKKPEMKFSFSEWSEKKKIPNLIVKHFAMNN